MNISEDIVVYRDILEFNLNLFIVYCAPSWHSTCGEIHVLKSLFFYSLLCSIS